MEARVLLFRPPTYSHVTANVRAYPPINLAYLASGLRQQGHEVEILDAQVGNRRTRIKHSYYMQGMEDEEIVNRVSCFEPDVVGISCMFSSAFPALVHGVELVRMVFSGPIYAGGYAATVEPQRVLREAGVDCVIRGEGEVAFPKAIAAGRRGVVEQAWEDVDSLTRPAWDLLDLDLYRRFDSEPGGLSPELEHSRAGVLLSSRGCPVGCNFCSVHLVAGAPLRRRTTQDVLDEIRWLRDEHGAEKLYFFDDNLTLNRAHAMDLFRGMVEEGLEMPWFTVQGTAAWNWDEELFDAAVASGLFYLNLPIESGSQDVLDDLMHKKPLKLGKIEDVIAKARDRNIPVSAWGIVGTPGETKRDIEKTLAFINDLDVDYRTVSAVIPYPGTDLYRTALAAGTIDGDFDVSRISKFQTYISTPEWSSFYVAARLVAWLMCGRVRAGHGVVSSVRRAFGESPFRVAVAGMFLALVEIVVYRVFRWRP